MTLVLKMTLFANTDSLKEIVSKTIFQSIDIEKKIDGYVNFCFLSFFIKRNLLLLHNSK